MTTEVRLDFAKKNGKVISNTKKTTTEKVDESKLTDKEKEEADKQKTYEVNGHKFNSLECKEAYKEGFEYCNFYGITGDFNPNGKYYGIYEFKKGFGGNVIEYIGQFDLKTSNFYYIYKGLKRIKKWIGR